MLVAFPEDRAIGRLYRYGCVTVILPGFLVSELPSPQVASQWVPMWVPIGGSHGAPVWPSWVAAWLPTGLPCGVPRKCSWVPPKISLVSHGVSHGTFTHSQFCDSHFRNCSHCLPRRPWEPMWATCVCTNGVSVGVPCAPGTQRLHSVPQGPRGPRGRNLAYRSGDFQALASEFLQFAAFAFHKEKGFVGKISTPKDEILPSDADSRFKNQIAKTEAK